jgi:hypothetical protein
VIKSKNAGEKKKRARTSHPYRQQQQHNAQEKKQSKSQRGEDSNSSSGRPPIYFMLTRWLRKIFKKFDKIDQYIIYYSTKMQVQIQLLQQLL